MNPIKKLRKLILILVLLVLVALVGIYLYIDTIAKTAIEKGGTYALGVETTVENVSVGITSGKFGIDNLNVANPEGYELQQFFTLGKGELEMSITALMSDKIEVPRFALSDIRVSLERKNGKANYDVIMENLAKLESKEDKTPEATDDGEGKRFIVNEVDIKNVSIHVDMLPELGPITRVDLDIPSIKLKNVGSDSDKGVLISELANILLKAILQAAAESGKLPLDMLNDLQGKLAKLGDLKGLGMEVTGEITSKVTEEINKVTKDIGDKVGKEIEKVTKDLGKDITKDLGKDVIPKDIGKDLGKDLDKGLKGLGEGLFGKDKK